MQSPQQCSRSPSTLAWSSRDDWKGSVSGWRAGSIACQKTTRGALSLTASTRQSTGITAFSLLLGITMAVLFGMEVY
jgi:hypothetical protein